MQSANCLFAVQVGEEDFIPYEPNNQAIIRSAAEINLHSVEIQVGIQSYTIEMEYNKKRELRNAVQVNGTTGYRRSVYQFPGTDIEAFTTAVENGTLGEYVSSEEARLKAGLLGCLKCVCAECGKPCGELDTYCGKDCQKRAESCKKRRIKSGGLENCVVCFAAAPTCKLFDCCSCKHDMLCNSCCSQLKGNESIKCPVCNYQ